MSGASVVAKFNVKFFHDTWGHLAPSKDKQYSCIVRLATDFNGDFILITHNGMDGPCFFSALTDAIFEIVQRENYNKVLQKKYEGVYDIPVLFKNYKIKFDFDNAVKLAGRLA